MDIHDVNEDLVKALVHCNRIEFVSKEFNEIRANHGKVNYIEDLLVKYQQISKLELKVDFRTAKNDEKSAAYRQEGNLYFSLKNKDYIKALEMYNKSICFAEEGSENISIGYANRSAIMFEWGRYKECLGNIKLAKDSKYPERLMHKLEKREKDCLALLSSQVKDESPHEFSLSYSAHQRIPFIADCLGMNYSTSFGRYIYTKKALKPGDLVSMEEPFCSVLLPSMKYIRCANCKKENFYTLIPCPQCTSAMFCSNKCMEEAFKMFHHIECPIIDFLHYLFNKIQLIALRVCLVALSIFKTTEDCIQFCTAPENQNRDAFNLDYDNFTKEQHYRAIHGLVTNQDKRSVADLFQRGVTAAVLRRYLLERTPLGDVLISEEHRDFLTDLLFRHIQTAPSNMHSVTLIEHKQETNDDQTFASAAYAFASLLNHSCAPNTVRIYNGTTMYIFILRPIPENGILYDNYGYHYATQPKKTRQGNLDTQYHFICKCEACKNDYPLYLNLPVPKSVPEEIQEDDIQALMAYSRQFALENYPRYCEFLKKYASSYPCGQISSVEESLKMALNILVDAIPLKWKY